MKFKRLLQLFLIFTAITISNSYPVHLEYLKKISTDESFAGSILDEPHIRYLQFSPDGKYLAASTCESKRTEKYGYTQFETKLDVTLWDTETFDVLHVESFDNVSPDFEPLAFSWDNSYLAIGFEQKIILLNLINKEKTKIIYPRCGEIVSLSFSPDGDSLALIMSHNVCRVAYIYTVSTHSGKKLRDCDGSKKILFLSDNTIISNEALTFSEKMFIKQDATTGEIIEQGPLDDLLFPNNDGIKIKYVHDSFSSLSHKVTINAYGKTLLSESPNYIRSENHIARSKRHIAAADGYKVNIWEIKK